MKLTQPHLPRTIVWSTVLAAACIMLCWEKQTAGSLAPVAVAIQSSVSSVARPDPSFDEKKVEGHKKCVDCHKSEVAALLASKHATRAFDILRIGDSPRKYAEEMGIELSQITNPQKSICARCHATPQVDDFGKLRVLSGVSCESCHNGSGGEDGWLNRHAVYGPPGTRREEESDVHYRRRAEACRKAGQARSSDLYQLARNCFACHVVGDEELAAAGHDHGEGFELVTKSLGEVRHNFHMDQSQNAEVSSLWLDPLWNDGGRSAKGRKRVMFITGQLVDLEISLRNLATATDESDFTDAMFDRIEEAYELLGEDVLDEIDDLPEVEEAVDAVEPVYDKLDDDGFTVDDKQLYLDAAEKVATAAKKFALRDGKKLAELDEEFEELDLVPTEFDNVYQP